MWLFVLWFEYSLLRVIGFGPAVQVGMLTVAVAGAAAAG